MKENRRKQLFPEVTDQEWNDWKWQIRNRIVNVTQLKKYIALTPEEEEGVEQSLSCYVWPLLLIT